MKSDRLSRSFLNKTTQILYTHVYVSRVFCQSLILSVPLSLFFSLPLSLFLSVSLSLFLSLSLALSRSFFYFEFSTPLNLSVFLSLFLFFLYVSLYPSFSRALYPNLLTYGETFAQSTKHIDLSAGFPFHSSPPNGYTSHPLFLDQLMNEAFPL